MIETRRAYGVDEPHGEFRVLVDRLWPRGLKKKDLNLDLWLREAAPSNELRRWFGHDPGRWEEFRNRYFAELDAHASFLDQAIQQLLERDPVVLLYGAHDMQHNNARALKEYLEARLDDRKKRR